MKLIQYRCEVCRCLMDSNQITDPIKSVPYIGFDNGPANLPRSFERLDPESARFHICHDCLRGLVQLATDAGVSNG